MARLVYGGTSADTAQDAEGDIRPGAKATITDVDTAAQLTGLLDFLGNPVPDDLPPADEFGNLRFSGPDGYTKRTVLAQMPNGPKVRVYALEEISRLAGEANTLATAAIPATEKAAVNGVATLDGDGLVPIAQLPQMALRNAVTLADLPSLHYVAHRGAGAYLAPENTTEALRLGAAMGADLLEFDVRALADGTAVAFHDSTLDRITTATGNLSDHTGASFQRLLIDAGAWFGGGAPNTRARTLEELLAEFGGRHLLLPEPKSTSAMLAVINAVRKYSLTESVIVQSFTRSDLQSAVSVGLHTRQLIANESGATANPPSALVADGIEYVSLNALTISDATIQSYIAEPTLHVSCYNVFRQHVRAHLETLGVAGFDSDEPVYVTEDVARYRRTTDPFALQTWYHGHITEDISPSALGVTNRGKFTSPDRWTVELGEYYMFALQGWACPLASPASYTLTFKVRFDLLGADSTRWPGCYFSAETDHAFDDTSANPDNAGYTTILRQNGTFALYRKDGSLGTTTLLDSVATAAPTQGTEVTIEIVVTPTDITVTRVDTSNVLTAADTTYRGGYIYLGRHGNPTFEGPEVSFFDVTVT